MWADIVAFFRALFNKWSAYILGGALGLSLTLWFGFGKTIKPGWYGAIIGAAFLFSVFVIWRDEHQRAERIALQHEAFVNSTNEEHKRDLEKQVAIERRTEAERKAAIWRPCAAINSYEINHELKNELVLKDDRPFEVDVIELLGPGDVKLAVISTGPPDPKKEHHINISHVDLLKLNNRHFNNGSIRYSVRRGESRFQGALPFIAEGIFLRTDGGGQRYWIRLIG